MKCIVCPDDFGCGRTLGDDFLEKLVNNVENLSTVFDEIYLDDRKVIIDKHNIVKMV